MILQKNDPSAVRVTASLIEAGKVVVLPCDTIYGLSSIFERGESVLKSLKGRDASKPFLVLATKQQAISLCENIPDDILDTWPASLTVILNAKSGGTIGIRVPDDEFLQSVLEAVGSPIYSTSVNMSGEPSLLTLDEIRNKFEEKVALVVAGFKDQGTTASTIINATTVPYSLVRQGSFDVSGLLSEGD